MVPIPLQDVIRKYIHYQEDYYKKNVPLSTKKELEDDYVDELATYDMRMSDLSYQGILDVSRRTKTFSIKG